MLGVDRLTGEAERNKHVLHLRLAPPGQDAGGGAEVARDPPALLPACLSSRTDECLPRSPLPSASGELRLEVRQGDLVRQGDRVWRRSMPRAMWRSSLRETAPRPPRSPKPTGLNLSTITSQKCEAVPGRALI